MPGDARGQLGEGAHQGTKQALSSVAAVTAEQWWSCQAFWRHMCNLKAYSSHSLRLSLCSKQATGPSWQSLLHWCGLWSRSGLPAIHTALPLITLLSYLELFNSLGQLLSPKRKHSSNRRNSLVSLLQSGAAGQIFRVLYRKALAGQKKCKAGKCLTIPFSRLSTLPE